MAEPRLYDQVVRALEITGPALWEYGESAGESDRLAFSQPDGNAPGEWVLVGAETSGSADEVEDLILEEPVARDLLASHFRRWLAARGWQVQMGFRRGQRTWRLADCLAFREGGGDRLDADYPEGADEMAVLSESVVTVAAHAVPPLPSRTA